LKGIELLNLVKHEQPVAESLEICSLSLRIAGMVAPLLHLEGGKEKRLAGVLNPWKRGSSPTHQPTALDYLVK